MIYIFRRSLAVGRKSKWKEENVRGGWQLWAGGVVLGLRGMAGRRLGSGRIHRVDFIAFSLSRWVGYREVREYVLKFELSKRVG